MLSTLIELFVYGLVSTSKSDLASRAIVELFNPLYELLKMIGL